MVKKGEKMSFVKRLKKYKKYPINKLKLLYKENKDLSKAYHKVSMNYYDKFLFGKSKKYSDLSGNFSMEAIAIRITLVNKGDKETIERERKEEEYIDRIHYLGRNFGILPCDHIEGNHGLYRDETKKHGYRIGKNITGTREFLDIKLRRADLSWIKKAQASYGFRDLPL